MRGRRVSKSLVVVAAAAGLLVAVGGVLGANPEKWKIARTAAGNAAAKSEMLRRTDLAAGWAGGAKKPDLNSTMPCSNYRPRQSDLTVVGAARTGWNGKGLLVDESANVLRTPRMVKLDWKRTVIAPQVIPCLRRGFKKHAAKNEKLVSLKYVPFPHVTSMTRAYRLVVDVHGAGGTVRIESDLVAIGRGRSELSMAVTGQASSARAVRNTARRLARIVAARLKR